MYSDAKIGGVGIWLDEIVPCLKDTETGEIKNCCKKIVGDVHL